MLPSVPGSAVWHTCTCMPAHCRCLPSSQVFHCLQILASGQDASCTQAGQCLLQCGATGLEGGTLGIMLHAAEEHAFQVVQLSAGAAAEAVPGESRTPLQARFCSALAGGAPVALPYTWGAPRTLPCMRRVMAPRVWPKRARAPVATQMPARVLSTTPAMARWMGPQASAHPEEEQTWLHGVDAGQGCACVAGPLTCRPLPVAAWRRQVLVCSKALLHFLLMRRRLTGVALLGLQGVAASRRICLFVASRSFCGTQQKRILTH